MKAKRLTPAKDGRRAIKEAARIVHRGGVVAFPTETVYGLAAHAFDTQAVEKVFRIKGRPSTNPLTLHFYSIAQVGALVEEVPLKAKKLMETFWPGPLTIVLRRKKYIPEVVTGGMDTVGLRIPDHNVALEFFRECGVPVVGPSANLFGRPSPTNADMVMDELGEVIDAVLDAGETHLGIESTVIDLSESHPTILRPGAISKEEIEAVIEESVKITPDVTREGLKPRYRPPVILIYSRKPVEKVKNRVKEIASRGQKILVLSLRKDAEALSEVADVVVFGNEVDMARKFFMILRDAHKRGKDVIVVDTLQNAGRLKDALLHRAERFAHEVWDD